MTEVIQTDIRKPINNIEDTFDCLQERLYAAELERIETVSVTLNEEQDIFTLAFEVKHFLQENSIYKINMGLELINGGSRHTMLKLFSLLDLKNENYEGNRYFIKVLLLNYID